MLLFLSEIKDQLNTVQKDILELKSEVGSLGGKSSKMLSSTKNEVSDLSHKINCIQDTLKKKSVLQLSNHGKLPKPDGFPENILFDNIDDLKEFDDLLTVDRDKNTSYFVRFWKF